MLRKALIIFSGNSAAFALLFARNLLVARLIPVADYGIAATFVMAMAVVEMASAFGLQQQIVQSKQGDDPRFQAALQAFQLMRGVAAAAALFVLSGPLARFMGIPEVIWAYQLLAVVPVLNALVHFDIHRLNRHMRFAPMMLTGILPNFGSLLLIWPLAHLFGDWQIMLWAILAQAALMAVTSHLVAERRYLLVWDRAILGEALRFGWPLLINAVLMFLVFQGDKLIVGNVMGMEALAIFSMGVTLTLTPTLVMAVSVRNLFLPRLSQVDRTTVAGRAHFDRLGRAALQVGVLNGSVLVLGAVVFGAGLVHLLLGPKYQGLVPLFTAFAVLHALRVFKSSPGLVALSCGHSSNSMVANIPRVLALPLGWLLMTSGGTMMQLLWLGIAAETVGFLLSMVLLWRRPGLAFGPLWPTAVAAVVFLVLCSAPFPAYLPAWGLPVGALVTFGLLFASMRDLHALIWRRPPISPKTPPENIG